MNLNELVYNLAVRVKAISTMRDEIVRIQEHDKQLTEECAGLIIKIGDAAFATGEEQPHPAVKVLPHTGEEPDVPRVQIDEDLNKYLNPEPLYKCPNCDAQAFVASASHPDGFLVGCCIECEQYGRVEIA